MRILIADCVSDFTGMVTETFAGMPELEIIACSRDGNEAYALVATQKPDVLLADTVLPGLDGLSLLRKIEQSSLPQKPLAALISSIAYPAMLDEARELNAQFFMLKPVDMEALTMRVLAMDTSHREKLLAQKAEKKIAGEVSKVMQTIGIPGHIYGHRLLREAIILAVKDRNAACSITKTIYPTLAKTFITTHSRVERNIDYAIRLAWEQRENGGISAFFGENAVKSGKKPTNSQFVAVLAEHVSMSIRKEDLL